MNKTPNGFEAFGAFLCISDGANLQNRFIFEICGYAAKGRFLIVTALFVLAGLDSLLNAKIASLI